MIPTDILGNIKLYNADNMKVMKTFKDKQFDLAIIDPPYGISIDKQMSDNAGTQHGVAKAKKRKYKATNWDVSPPENEYFKELFRVSKNQIIWGANHFISRIPYDSPCWIVWDKHTNGYFADCELAWASFGYPVRKFSFVWNGMLQGNMKNKEERIHPTQKPVQLYKWLLQNYAKEGDTILDTHFGSLSIGIACHDMKFDLTAIELDKDYYEQAKQRLINHQLQLQLF